MLAFMSQLTRPLGFQSFISIQNCLDEVQCLIVVTLVDSFVPKNSVWPIFVPLDVVYPVKDSN